MRACLMNPRWYPLACLVLGCLLSACGLRPVVSLYEADTPKQAVRAWADAYNAGQYRQLTLLVHPARRDIFEENLPALRKRLKRSQIKRFELGGHVKIREQLNARVVTLEYHNGRSARVRQGMLVQAKDRWWVWSY
jgi:hypothetical protein